MANTTDTLQLRLALSGLASVEAGLKQLSHSIAEIKTLAFEVGGAFLGIKGGEALGDLAHQTLNLGSQLHDLKARVGATIPELMAMRQLLSENGASAGDAAILLQHLERSIVEAAENGGALSKAFNDIGLSAEKLSAMPTGEAFRTVVTGLASLDNEFKKTQVSMAIFGRSGADVKMAFSDLAQVQAAFAGKSTFQQVMERSAKLFDDIEDNLDRLSKNGIKMMAGFLDQVAPLFKATIEDLGHVDLTVLGQNFGALAGVVIQSWRDAKFPEMLGLLIEAGFELGIEGGKKVFAAVWASVTSDSAGQLFEALINAILTFGIRAGQFLLKVVETPVIALAGGFDWLYDQIRVGFQTAFNWIRDHVFAPLINWYVDEWNKAVGSKIGKTLQRVATNTGPVEPGKTLDESMQDMLAFGQPAFGAANKFLEDSLSKTREILGLNQKLSSTDNTHLNAVQRLAALMEEYKKQIASANEEGKEHANVLGQEIRTHLRLKQLGADELQLRSQLVQIQSNRARVDGDFTLTSAQKYQLQLASLKEERETTEKIIALMKQRVELLDKIDPSRADAARKQMISEQGKLPGIDQQMNKLGPDPNSFSQQWAAMFTRLGDQFGTWAQQTAKSFETVFNAAIASISTGITGLIMGTKTWGQALYEIGNTILTTVVQSIVQMGVRWIATQILMATVGRAIQASVVASTAPMAAIASAIWAAPATLAATATFGAAAAAAPAEILAAQGAVLASSIPQFAAGGRPDIGRMSLVGERGPELFVPDMPGTILPAHITAQFLGARAGAGASASGTGGTKINIGVLSDRSEIGPWIRTRDGEAAIVDIVKRNWGKL